LAYDESNTDYGQFDDSDDDKKLSADGHYWASVDCPPSSSRKVVVIYGKTILLLFKNSFNNVKSSINQNDAKARPIMINEANKKWYQPSPDYVCHSLWGQKGQRSHKSGLLVLLDTGCSHSMMSAAIAKHMKRKHSTASSTWLLANI
jgi:hypothetical protein